jgi:hypothetical protein
MGEKAEARIKRNKRGKGIGKDTRLENLVVISQEQHWNGSTGNPGKRTPWNTASAK